MTLLPTISLEVYIKLSCNLSCNKIITHKGRTQKKETFAVVLNYFLGMYQKKRKKKKMLNCKTRALYH